MTATRKLWNNTSQLKKIRYRFTSYMSIAVGALRKGVSPMGLLYSRFPFVFGTPETPASVSIELTDACDLKCLYCNNPLFSNPRTFMPDPVFEALLKRLDEFGKLDRIRVGGGEPTLHPKFAYISAELAKRARYLTIVTNVQWKKEAIAPALLQHYDLIELSVDAGGKAVYEESRTGASYELLYHNLEKLNRLKKETGSKAHINVRLMVRPSNAENRERETAALKPLSDTIMPQYVIKHFESAYSDNVFLSKHSATNAYPRCTLPFKDLQVKAGGNISLCQVTGSTINPEKKRAIGNVLHHSMRELWHGEELTRLRNAHKNRINADMEVCRGCRGI